MIELKPGVEPFPFQERVAQFGSHKAGEGKQQEITVLSYPKGRVILDVDPGLGKSLMAILTYTRLAPDRKVLVLCSKKALNTWRREWSKWTNIDKSKVILVEGDPYKRKTLWNTPGHVYVITYQSGLKDMAYILKHKFTFLIADECKIWRNRQRASFKGWQSFVKSTEYAVLTEGTLISRGPQDLWTFLHMMRPKLFSSYWKFVHTFCIVIDGFFGKEIVGAQNTEGLAKVLQTTLIRIRADDPEVRKHRPPLIRDIVPIDMTPEQAKIYNELTDKLITITDSGEIIYARSTLGLIVKQRQLLICPKILDPKLGYGAAIEHLLLELEDDPHHVIFTPFAKAIPFIREAILSAGFKEPYILKGGAKADEIRYVEEGFNSPEGEERSCICTTGFAESFELYTARQARFIGYDWTQVTNYQAEKRLQRLITPHPVTSWYYQYEGTVDEYILSVLNSKQTNVKMTFQNYIPAIRQLKNLEGGS